MDARIVKKQPVKPAQEQTGQARRPRGRKPAPERPEVATETSDAELEVQIDKIKQELASLGSLRPGSMTEQYNTCGTPGCRCKTDPSQKHGPYYQISFTRKGRSSTKFVRAPDAPAIRQELTNYERLKFLVDTWVDMATELSNRRLARK